jgi:hypothetical protein
MVCCSTAPGRSVAKEQNPLWSSVRQIGVARDRKQFGDGATEEPFFRHHLADLPRIARFRNETS